MEQKNDPIMGSLGNYSKTNIPMMLLDESRALSGQIWELADRRKWCEEIASDSNLYYFVELVHDVFYDGILYRRVENLSPEKQCELADLIIKMKSSERGKLILTTTEFQSIEEHLLRQVCKIKFNVEVSKKSGLATEDTALQPDSENAALRGSESAEEIYETEATR